MRKTIKKPSGLVLIAFVLLAACTPISADQLSGTSWVLVSLDGKTQVGEIIGGRAVTLYFESSGEAGGSGGCNSFGATYEADPANGSISFSEIVSTLMACTDEGVGDVEAAYFAALSTADRYEVTGDSLTITGGGHSLVFVRISEGM